ncbi:MAG: alpha/beta fold hydrolase [Caldithrix sp.]|nr:alpha/beta fold hydrolase [Caldithrix sp.]
MACPHEPAGQFVMETFLKDSVFAPYTIEETMITVQANVRLRCLSIVQHSSARRPAVVFIPGWITQMVAWREVITAMVPHYDVYYIETREKISAMVDGKTAYTVQAIARDIRECVHHLELSADHFVLFGSSLGATAILEACSQQELQPRALILVAPNAVFRVPLYWRLIVRGFYPGWYALLKPVVKAYLKHFRLNVQADDQQFEKYSRALDAADPWKLKKAVLAFARYQVWPILKDIEPPVLLVAASQDKLHEPQNLQRMYRELLKAHWVDLETNQATHSKEVVKAMNRFMGAIDINGRV